jgi:hypothetical protein
VNCPNASMLGAPRGFPGSFPAFSRYFRDDLVPKLPKFLSLARDETILVSCKRRKTGIPRAEVALK